MPLLVIRVQGLTLYSALEARYTRHVVWEPFPFQQPILFVQEAGRDSRGC